MTEKALWTEDFKPRRGECVASIIVRLAPHGRLTPSELVHWGLHLRGGFLAHVCSRTDGVERLAQLTGLPFEDLVGNTWTETSSGYRILGREVPSDWIETGNRRFAPGVLARDGDEPYIRTIWQIAAIRCDPDSGEALRSRCWNCNGVQTWLATRTIWQCACGADQRDGPACSVPQDVLLASRHLASLFGDGPVADIPSPFNSLPDAALFALLGWFGYFSDLREGARLRPSAVNAAKGYQALRRWPASFDEVLVRTLRDFVHDVDDAPLWMRTQMIAQLMAVIRRAGSRKAIAFLSERAERVLGVACDKRVLEKIYGPVPQPPGRDWAMRSSQERIKFKTRWSR